MQPDQQNNYWPKDSAQPEPSKVPEMYTPAPNFDEPIVSNGNPYQKPVIENAPVHWSANEYVYREKNKLWFIVFAFVIVVFILIDLFLLKSYTFSVLVIVMAAAVIIYSRRPPRIIDYALSGNHGLYIGERLYHFNEFKAFGVIQDDGHNSIMLIPVKRFSPGVSVYFPQEVGEEIVDIFGARLPMETIKLDAIDIIVRKLRL